MKRESQFYGPNLGYVLELYERYREDPESVDERTRDFFDSWSPPEVVETNGQVTSGAATTGVDVEKIVGVVKYIRAIRDFGHRAAQLDPLGSKPPGDPTLDAEFHHISEEELEALPAGIVNAPGVGPIPERTSTAREAVDELRRIYCNTAGYDFGHIHTAEERFWLRDAAESERYNRGLNEEEARRLLKNLTRVDTFEKFLHKAFLGQKRFSVEGTDMVVPMLNLLVRFSAEKGTPEVVLGMAHRGRLNVLAHVLDKPYSTIFGEFQQPDRGESSPVSESPGEGWVGDVKYHLGIRGFQLPEEEADQKVLINLAPNPSHLEHVDPVVEGMARAAQETRDEAGPPEQNEEASLPVLIHGDAAFPGEGVVAETLNLSRLPGYKTGGTIHIITNNQLGFTTEKHDARSTTYASDLAKGYEMPVVHVNADDPEACLAAVRIAYAYREEFRKDFMIDLIGYRRYGHNEGDEPTYTQPKMYEVIRDHPSVRELWAKELERRGVIEEGEGEKMVEEMMSRMEEIRKKPSEGIQEEDVVTDQPHTPLVEIPDTSVLAERLQELNAALLERPEGFEPNDKLERLFQKNRGDLESIDWAHAEALAFASLLEDGVPIRLTGQDTVRGTFSQRHAGLYNTETGEAYVPLQNIPQAKASFAVYNSPLSEIAVLGFEYGYSVNAHDALVLWEAQYGDFANVGQPMIDQFIVSGQSKWGQTSDLVLLLPHGYEGQGPEHSSARLERFLQLAAKENIRVANLTTAAQYFHLLRAQAALKDNQRPLVIMAPKSLLRHPMAASRLEDLTDGSFQPVLADEEASADAVERLILCSGKIYTELAGSDYREEAAETAVGRIELLYPFPEERVREMVEGYKELREILWVQEEPKNMGAWTFVEPRLRALTGEEIPITYIGKPARPSPAQGSARFHREEHAGIVQAAFGRAEGDLEEAEAAAQGTQARAPGPSDQRKRCWQVAVEIHVPELGESVADATVGRWLKQEGEAVKSGDPLVELETDKINFEVEAEQDGVLESIAKGEGETVNVGEVIGTIGEDDGSEAPAAEEQESTPEVDESAEAEQPEPEAETEETAEETDGHREMEEVRASPSVRKLAKEYDVDLAEVSGSGSGGRVTREDVERLIREQGRGAPERTEEPAPEEDGRREQRPAPAAEDGRGALEERVRMSRRRQTIARRLVEAQQTAAMLTTFNEADMTAVMDLRNQRKEEFQERHGVKLGFMSFFVKAAIGALKAFPKINAELQGEELILKHYYDIGVAVNTEEGLVVPVVRDADKKSFADIEQAIGDLAVKARERRLALEDLQGGTFTITNGGIFGSLLSTPILNAPQVAILGMHKIQQRPVVVDGEIQVRPMMYLALSYDHRIVDGADAVSFLVRIKELIEDPTSLLLEG